MKERLDKELYKRGLVKSRTHAQTLIEKGNVFVNGKVIKKINTDVTKEDELIANNDSKYVSRGGDKLEHALLGWSIGIKNKTVIDVGSSTGGFTDCVLKHGASSVYAIDVGTEQFDKELKKDSRVVLLENTDIRSIENLPYLFDIAVIDVSFISLSHVIKKTASLLKNDGMIIALVKPQFEIGPHIHKTKGIVRNETLHEIALENVRIAVKNADCKIVKETESPILGGKGNKEFLILIEKI
jgi:23S rRNA (cytidine1920-2'-O)/16S rRNA (cytidine1409-2'-O)-methyltransferase